MTLFQRVKSILFSLLMIAAAVLMVTFSDQSYNLILIFLGTGLFLSGIGTLFYYFTMARFMVGGKSMLGKGVLQVDFALLTMSLTDVPKFYVLMYLAGIHAFSGLVEILRANETRKNGSKNYKLKLAHGVLNVFMALCCIIFIKKTGTAVYIYCSGLIYSAILRIITAFRKSAIVYVR